MKNFILAAGAAILLAGCGGGSFEAPADPDKVRSAVVSDFGLKCADINDFNNVNCGGTDVMIMHQGEPDDGTLSFQSARITHSELDRSAVIKFVKRFGFTEDDFNAVTGQGQRITKGGFTMDSTSRQHVGIYQK